MKEEHRSSIEKDELIKNNDVTNEVVSKDISIDFWSSQGNIGEKMNFLIGLNVLVINLQSALIQSLISNNLIRTDFSVEIERIREFLSNMQNLPFPSLNLRETIREVDNTISTIMVQLLKEKVNLDEQIKPIETTDSVVVGFFNKNLRPNDKWGIIESIELMLASYSNLSHLAFPNYYLEACKEIFLYEFNEENYHPNYQDVIQTPALKIKKIITKLIKEAPSARLLQNLYRYYLYEQEMSFSSEELIPIQKIVKKYFINISNFLKGERTLQDSLRASSAVLRAYNLGSGDLESRIPNVSFIVAKDIQNETENLFGNELKQAILSETIILIHRLNDSILHNNRFISYLKHLK